ncbi:MAG: hypothetical protein V1790_18480 [Planctomycetota bacterium]
MDLIQGELESRFPKLRPARYTITSPSDVRYNCIAWAAGDQGKWWEPHPQYFWPEGSPVEYSVAAYASAYSFLGYEECDSHAVEQGYEKIAVFANKEGVPTHAARQLATGYWTSKLGKFVDIEHALEDLEGATYGRVTLVLRRGKPRGKSV